ncbi:MAG: tetratricopeptide repeat protein [Planctomycetes bacterium]|nr:tetratricopeptide repeat protein [Planctomycetota bacterium]
MTDHRLHRPQALGLTPWPHGALLFEDADGVVAFSEAVVRDGAVPDTVPDGLQYWSLAQRDSLQDARESLAGDTAVSDPVRDYNHFVLAPSADRYETLRAAFTEAAFQPLVELLDVAAYQAGVLQEVPEPRALDGELLAYACSVRAADHLERVAPSTGDPGPALELLDQGIAAAEASPGLAAQLSVSKAELLRASGAPVEVVEQCLRSAFERLPEKGFDSVRGELSLELGGLLQESSGVDRRRLTESVSWFQESLRLLDRTLHRRAYGFAQMRLGLAYLSMPMREAGDALRMGVATQSLRESIKTLNREQEPELWAAAATNLANAYQLLPSGHQAENLDESISLYSQILDLRPVDRDPLGHARTLANRANACASLSRFDQAIEDLSTACPLLQRFGGEQEWQASKGLLEDLKRSRITGMRVEVDRVPLDREAGRDRE